GDCAPFNDGDSVVNNGDGTITITTPGANYQGTIDGHQYNGVEVNVEDLSTDTSYYNTQLLGFNTQPLAALQDTTINEGDTYTLSGSFSDPGATSWTEYVDYGDGAGLQQVALSQPSYSLTHLYAAGVYPLRLLIIDDLGIVRGGVVAIIVNPTQSNASPV